MWDLNKHQKATDLINNFSLNSLLASMQQENWKKVSDTIQSEISHRDFACELVSQLSFEQLKEIISNPKVLLNLKMEILLFCKEENIQELIITLTNTDQNKVTSNISDNLTILIPKSLWESFIYFHKSKKRAKWFYVIINSDRFWELYKIGNNYFNTDWEKVNIN